MSEFWGKVHFWLSLLFMNLIFTPMFAQGLAGMSRRMADGGATYAGVLDPATGEVGLTKQMIGLNAPITHAALALGAVQLIFIINFFWSIRNGKKIESDNPWSSTTLEWQTPTPPPHGNFAKAPVVYRGPYEYSVPGAAKDFTPQNQPN